MDFSHFLEETNCQCPDPEFWARHTHMTSPAGSQSVFMLIQAVQTDTHQRSSDRNRTHFHLSPDHRVLSVFWSQDLFRVQDYLNSKAFFFL